MAQRRATRRQIAATAAGEVAEVAAVDAREETEAATGKVICVGYAPIVRRDEARRELELCATSEAVDSFGTIFSYAASKDAFTRWMGNVREMHERKAVGQRVAVRFDDGARKVYVTIRISHGAQDTWEKVCDGTLRGASIGAANVKWQPALWPAAEGQREVKIATGYDLVELSLVDNPSNPDALGFTFVRDAVPDLEMLDRLEESAGEGADVPADVQMERRGHGDRRRDHREEAQGIRDDNRHSTPSISASSSATSALKSGSALSGSAASAGQSERLHEAARSVLAGCGCVVCAAALAALGAEIGEEADEGEQETGMGQATNRLREAAAVRAMGASLGAGLRASTQHLDSLDAGMREVRRVAREGGESLRAIQAQMSQVVGTVSSEVASAMARVGELEGRLERLEAQPLPGGPAARAVEKTHPLHTRDAAGTRQVSAQEQYHALEALAGRLADPQAQIVVAAELIRLQREEGGI